MDDDLAFCLQRFDKEQRAAFESARNEEQQKYQAALHNAQSAYTRCQEFHQQLTDLAKDVFHNLQRAVTIAHDTVHRELNHIFFPSTQSMDQKITETSKNSEFNRLGILIVTIHSVLDPVEGSSWLPDYIIPILRESIISTLRSLNGSDQTDISNTKVESIIKAIGQSKAIQDANRQYSESIQQDKERFSHTLYSLPWVQPRTVTAILKTFMEIFDDGYNYSKIYILSNTHGYGEQFWIDKLYKFTQLASEYVREDCEKLQEELCKAEKALRDFQKELVDISNIFAINSSDIVALVPKWNRVYSQELTGTHWTGSLNRAGKPYYCPLGWKRYALKVKDTQEEFDKVYGDYHIAYHGTKSTVASSIIKTGLRGSKGCYREGLNVYLSPSIEYSAHPRYAKPWKRDENGQYYQMVFQCRVNPQLVKNDLIKPETLLANNAKNMQIDPNFRNNELEWVVPADKTVSKRDLICYGIMLRITSDDPSHLPSSKWWPHMWWNDKK